MDDLTMSSGLWDLTSNPFLRRWLPLKANSTDLWQRVMTTRKEARAICVQLRDSNLGSRLNRRARKLVLSLHGSNSSTRQQTSTQAPMWYPSQMKLSGAYARRYL